MELTANALQTVQVNGNVIFTDTPVKGGGCIIHREGSGLVTLRGLTEQCRARFQATFGANIAVPADQTTGPISLALSLDGEPVESTTMIIDPTDVSRFGNVSSSVYIDVPRGCCSHLSVRNTSTIPVSVQNANLILERIA